MFPLSSRQALLPGSHLPNYHPYKEAKRPLTSAGLSPPLVLQPGLLLPCRSCLSASLCPSEHSPSVSCSVLSLSLTASPPPLPSLYSFPNTFHPSRRSLRAPSTPSRKECCWRWTESRLRSGSQPGHCSKLDVSSSARCGRPKDTQVRMGTTQSIHARSLSPPELCACVAGEGNSNAQAQTLSALQPRGLWRAFCSIPPSPINSLHKLKFWTSSALCFTTLCCSGSTKG